MLGLWAISLIVSFGLVTAEEASTATQRHILVFGGNGFLGSRACERFIRNADNVTIVNRGNWYWDSSALVRPFVRHIVCDRSTYDQCEDVKDYIDSVDKFDAVIDFSAYSGQDVKHTSETLQGKVGLYVLISTDSVYDVCDKQHDGPSKETDDKPPEDEERKEELVSHHGYGYRKLQAEEELIAQRTAGGFPFVILRLPDVLGPRDTTFRFWIYQLWLRLASELPEHAVDMPEFLVEYPMSFVYVEDVADVVYSLMKAGPEVLDQVINLAWPQSFTLVQVLKSLNVEMGLEDFEYRVRPQEDRPIFFYPSVRRGPLDVSKAESLLSWKPTPWEDAIKDSVEFYENAIKDDKYTVQRDEIVQIVGHHLFADDATALYNVLEKIYGIDLNHFHPKDEL